MVMIINIPHQSSRSQAPLSLRCLPCLSSLTILHVTGGWAGPGDEATSLLGCSMCKNLVAIGPRAQLVQWNLSTMDMISEVSLFQRENNIGCPLKRVPV